MHELSITQSVLSIVLEKANEAHASKVSKINIVIGELSGVVEECVQFYFDLLSKDTIAAETTVSFRQSHTQLRCRTCATIFSPYNSNWACPNCREQKIEIISGRELYIESIEVE
jgi:hydrogenase nickel incorporation protein HypA/HybF